MAKKNGNISRKWFEDTVGNISIKAIEREKDKCFEQALVEYSKALLICSGKASIYTARAKLYIEIGDIKNAISNARKAYSLRISPKQQCIARSNSSSKGATQTGKEESQEGAILLARLLDCSGILHHDNKQYGIAIAYFSNALSVNNQEPKYLVHRALSYIYTGKLQLAYDDLERATLFGPLNINTLVLKAKLGRALGGVETQEKSLIDFKAAALSSNQHPEVIAFQRRVAENLNQVYRIATDKLLLQEFKAAKQHLLEALKIGPSDIKCLLLLASVCRSKGDFSEALNYLRDASESHIQNYRKHQEGNVDDRRNLEHPEIIKQRCLLFNDMAMKEFRNGNQNNALLLLNRAISSLKSQINDSDKVVRSRNQANRNKLLLNLRDFYVNRGDTFRELSYTSDSAGTLTDTIKFQKCALGDYHSAFEIDRQDAHIKTRLSLVHNALGISYFNEGKTILALKEFDHCIELNPTIAEYHVHRGNVFSALNDSTNAYMCFKKALKLDPEHRNAALQLTQYQK